MLLSFITIGWFQAPINDDSASGLLIGLSASVTAAHITRAVLESFAFVIKLQYETMLADCGRTVNHIRYDSHMIIAELSTI